MSKELKDEDCWFIGQCPKCSLQMGFHVVTRLPKPKFYCERCKKYYHIKDFHDYWVQQFLSESLDKIIHWCSEKGYRTDSMTDIKEFIRFLMTINKKISEKQNGKHKQTKTQ